MRGIILAGGFGTRCKPATNVINKHLLSVYSHQGATPMIYYPIHTLVKSGIKDILIITSDEAAGLIVETLGDGSNFGADFTYKIQTMHDPKKPIGIASALKLCKNYTGEQKFAVILGDNFYEESFAKEVNNFKNGDKQAQVFLKSVGSEITRFGCATVDQDGKVIKIVEKPKNSESDLAVTGLYFYTPDVYKLAEECKVSDRGELEISHINDHYAKIGNMISTQLTGYWSDMGVPESMRRTTEFINNSTYSYSF
jgi:glucose-1-phosphate thymidylyltransferase